MTCARHLAIAAAACLAAGSLSACTGKASNAAPNTTQNGQVPRTAGVYVQPPSVSLLASRTFQFRAEVVGLSSTDVTWSLDPANCGTLTPSGAVATYVTPPVVGSSCTVTARSVVDQGKVGTGRITVIADVSNGAPGGGGTTYQVGEGMAYTSIGAVPWYTLQPGDTVEIYPGTYAEKFLVSTSGTPTQWIRVRGVPAADGTLPVISGAGATTSANMHWRWPDASGANAVQALGVVSLAVGAGGSTNPAYVEIANLQIQGGNPNNTFTTQAGAAGRYTDFTSCIYAKSPRHLLVRDNVLTDCGQGFYVWTGSGANTGWYDQLAQDVTVRNNYILGNGWTASSTSHQIYTECDGIVVEGNRFGPMRTGSVGSQVKDRSAGTVVRYNFFDEAAPAGYTLDLVEPQEGCPSLCYSTGATIAPNAKYLQTFVYGNVFRRSVANSNFVHWNEDHGDVPPKGRAAEPNGRLYFYANTIVDGSGQDLLFNETKGAYECPTYDLPGRVDFRNNLVYSTKSPFAVGEYCYGRPRTGPPDYAYQYQWSHGAWDFGPNWVSTTVVFYGSVQTGFSGITSPAGNDPGFTNLAGGDYTLTGTPSAGSIGGELPGAVTQVTQNYLGLDLTPLQQYVFPNPTQSLTPKTRARAQAGAGSDAGAFER